MAETLSHEFTVNCLDLKGEVIRDGWTFNKGFKNTEYPWPLWGVLMAVCCEQVDTDFHRILQALFWLQPPFEVKLEGLFQISNGLVHIFYFEVERPNQLPNLGLPLWRYSPTYPGFGQVLGIFDQIQQKLDHHLGLNPTGLSESGSNAHRHLLMRKTTVSVAHQSCINFHWSLVVAHSRQSFSHQQIQIILNLSF